MADKYSELIRRLERMESILVKILSIVTAKDELDELFGEDPYDERDYDPRPDQIEGGDPGESTHRPRRNVEVMSHDGVIFYEDWNELDPRIQQAITLSVKEGAPYQLYQDPSGNIRIMADNAVANKIHRMHTPMTPGGDV